MQQFISRQDGQEVHFSRNSPRNIYILTYTYSYEKIDTPVQV